MNTLFNHLILILILSLVVASPYEARKLTTSNGGLIFTVDLIHRHSLLPHKTPPSGSLSQPHSATGLYYSFLNEKTGIEAEVTPGRGDYLMKIALGSPPVDFIGVADTGSDLIWVQCSSCLTTQTCIPQQFPLFNPTTSSTYHAISCTSPACKYPDIHSGCLGRDPAGTGACMYAVGHGDNTTSSGVLSIDIITFPSSSSPSAAFTLPSSVFGCGTRQQGSLSSGEGIIGLGAGPLSLVSQLGSSINHKFSYCLVPAFSGATSKLNFGADVAGSGSVVVSTPLIIKDPPVFYYLNLNGISIGDGLVSVGQEVIIDSGTTLTRIEAGFYSGVRDAVIKATRLTPVDSPSEVLDLCFDTKELVNSDPPDMVFHFAGADVVLKRMNVFLGDEEVTCLTIVPVVGKKMIFGNLAQVNFEVGYDLQAQLVSFAPKDCTNVDK